MFPKETALLPAIILIPLLGALFNGLFGKRLGKGIVSTVAVAAPLIAFFFAAALFFGLHAADHGPLLSQTSVVVLKAKKDTAGSSLPGRLNKARRELGKRDDLFKIPEIEGKDRNQVLRLVGPASLAGDEALKTLAHRHNLVVAPAASAAPRSYRYNLGTWIHVGNFKVDFEFVVDRLSIILMLVITGVGFLIHLYSTDYMGAEPRGTYARYFSYLNLFIASMLVLVMGGNLLILFIGWEGVGMCSYLLIGFDYEDAKKAACGTKAFVVNRIGDMGVVLGMFCLLAALAETTAGGTLSLNFQTLNLALGGSTLNAGLIGAGCLLLFFGCTGKSAQIPLHLWLPDAMAGPTPVSALIHAATMVTAGIYLIARMSPIFAGAEVIGVPVLGIVALIGGLTAFFAGAAAIGQDDIKKVLAYSTVSQLGYMFLGVGALAMGAAVFHLVAHAFFKAVLFLGAGAVIHATHTQSMRRMGGLKNYMPTTYWTMAIGALALAGFPLLSGFFSKDMILLATLLRAKAAGAHWIWYVLYLLGLGTGFLTAVYSTRLIGMTFWGDYRGGGPGGRHPHAAPSAMALPLFVLGVLTIGAALLGLPALAAWMEPGAEILPHYLAPVVAQASDYLVNYPAVSSELYHRYEIGGLLVGAMASLFGVAVGWKIWGSRAPSQVGWESQVSGQLASIRQVLANAWYYDEWVNKRFVQPAVLYLSALLWEHVDDNAIDRGLVDGTGRVAVQLSLFTRVFQTGHVARYAAYFVVGAVVILASVHLYSI
ncbi:MAG: NADH-quinone oxidoreductase subunit L [Planctomycetes bacterium]|nr:NADH-quinone oxidoreductase subunit L [Planctomycetota bacterium]